MIVFFNYHSLLRTERNIQEVYDYFDPELLLFFDNGSSERSDIIKNFNVRSNDSYQKGYSTLLNYWLDECTSKTITISNASVLLNPTFINYVAACQYIEGLAYSSPAYTGQYVQETRHRQILNKKKKGLKFIKNNQLMLCSFSREFIEILRRVKMGPYNTKLPYGWGWETEVALVADALNLNHGYLPEYGFEWTRNYTSKKLNNVTNYHVNAMLSVEAWHSNMPFLTKRLIRLYLNSGKKVRHILANKILYDLKISIKR